MSSPNVGWTPARSHSVGLSRPRTLALAAVSLGIGFVGGCVVRDAQSFKSEWINTGYSIGYQHGKAGRAHREQPDAYPDTGRELSAPPLRHRPTTGVR